MKTNSMNFFENGGRALHDILLPAVGVVKVSMGGGLVGRAFATKGHGSLAGSFRAGTGNNHWHPRSLPHVVPHSHSLLVDAYF